MARRVRARLRRRGPFGLHTHWTSPTHARPTGGDPAARVRKEADWLREQELEPAYFCGGGWYTDDAVRRGRARARARRLHRARRRCRTRASCRRRTRSGSSRAQCSAPLPRYVHAYFHDYDLLDARRRLALVTALSVLGRRRRAGDGLELAR